MIKKLLVLLIILFYVKLNAQSVQVLDETKNTPIEGVHVYDIDNNDFFVTDKNGMFEISDGSAFQFDHISYNLTTVLRDSILNNNYKVYLKKGAENLPEMVVTAYRFEEKLSETGLQVKGINSLKLVQSNASNTADLLTKTGQVYVQKSQMGGGSPVLRGFEANKILLVVDGIRLNNAIYRGGHLQNSLTIGQASIQNVDVVLGPGSVMFGSDALGGVISFTTFKPKLNKVSGNLQTKYSSAFFEKTMSFGLNLGNEKIANYTAFSFSDFDDLTIGKWRLHGNENWGKRPEYIQTFTDKDVVVKNKNPNKLVSTGYRQYDVLNKTFVPVGSNELMLNFQYSISSNIPRYDRLNDYRDGSLRFAQWDYGPQKRLLTAVHYNVNTVSKLYDKLQNTVAFQAVEESRMDRKFNNPIQETQKENVKVVTVNSDAIKGLGTSKHKIQYGIEWAWNDVKSTAFQENIWSQNDTLVPETSRYPDGKNRTNSYSAYTLLRFDFSDEWKVKLGGRFAAFNLKSSYVNQPFEGQTFNAFDYLAFGGTYYLGVTYQPIENSRINLNVSSGFRAPNLDDVGKIFDPFDGAVVVPNGEITPEYINNFDLQWQHRFGKNIITEIGGYYSYANNLIKRTKSTLQGQDSILYDGNLAGVYVNDNAGKAYITGCHAELTLIDNNGKWESKHSFVYTKGWDVSNKVPLGHVPPIYGHHDVSFKWKAIQQWLWIGWNAKKPEKLYSASEDKQDEALNGLFTPAWFTLNYQVDVTLNNNFNILLGVENILDMHYVPFASGVSGAGRNFKVQLRATF